MRKFERVALLKETTMKIVARRTMVGLSMRMVSDESGVNQSMIYRDFKTKDNLLRVCYEEVYEDFFSFFKEKMHTKTFGEQHVLGYQLHPSVVPRIILASRPFLLLQSTKGFSC